MKRKISILVLVLVLLSFACLPAYAAADAEYVVDEAGFLSEAEWIRLEASAASISEKYDCGVYIFTVADLNELGYGSDPYVSAYSHYADSNMGLGEDKDGIILFISAQYMDYAVFVHGRQAEYAFNEYGLAELESEYIGFLSDREWFKGFNAYVSGCGSYLSLAAEGEPVREGQAGNIGLGLIIGAVIAIFVCKYFKGQLKSVRKGAEAMEYNVGGINLTHQMDQFTHTTVVKRKIKSDSGGSSARSGGGGHGRSGRL